MIRKYQDIDEVLGMFVSTDSLRPVLLKPWRVGRFVFAGNGHIAIKLPAVMVKQKYPTIAELEDPTCKLKKVPDVQRVIDDATLLESPIVVTVQDIRKTLLKLDTEPVYEDCEGCKGTGKIHCVFCGHDYDCEDCDGSGKSNVAIGKDFSINDNIKIGNNYFFPNVVFALLWVAKISGYDEVVLKSNEVRKMVLFDVGEIQVLIAPKHVDDDYYDFQFYEIEIREMV